MFLWGPKTEERIIELLSLLWRQHKPEEGIHPKRERERERERDKRPLGDPIGKDKMWRENPGE